MNIPQLIIIYPPEMKFNVMITARLTKNLFGPKKEFRFNRNHYTKATQDIENNGLYEQVADMYRSKCYIT